jgi:hypothetical protein
MRHSTTRASSSAQDSPAEGCLNSFDRPDLKRHTWPRTNRVWRAECWKSDLAASVAIEIYRRIPLTPESAHLNARSARVAPTRFSPEGARTAAATWLPAPSGLLPHFTNIRHRRAASTIRKAARALSMPPWRSTPGSTKRPVFRRRDDSQFIVATHSPSPRRLSRHRSLTLTAVPQKRIRSGLGSESIIKPK